MKRPASLSAIYDVVARAGWSGKYMAAIIFLAFAGSVVFTHEAHATFFAARGNTKIYGIDRVSGTTYTAANPVDRLYVFPNDPQMVGWRATVWNGGDLGNQAPWLNGTTVTVKNRYFDGTSSTGSAAKPHALVVRDVIYYDRPEEEPLLIAGVSGFSYEWGYNQSNQQWFPPTIRLSGAGVDVPGKQYCQYASANPAGYNVIPYSGAYGFSILPPSIVFGRIGNKDFDARMACAEVRYVYNLMPSIAFTNKAQVQSGSTNRPSIAQSMAQGNLPSGATGPTYSQSTQWMVTQVIVDKSRGGTIPNQGGGTSNQQPCNTSGTASYYFGRPAAANSAVTCSVVKWSGNNSNHKTTVFNSDLTIKSGDSPYAVNPGILTGFNPATMVVCYALSVESYEPYISGNTWRHSALDCSGGVASDKKPKLQVIGDDVRVNGKIETVTTDQMMGGALHQFGSWAQYASYSKNANAHFATAAGLRAPTMAASSPQSSWSALTFANAAGVYGSFSNDVSSPGATGVKKLFSPLATASNLLPSGNLNSVASSKTPYLVNGAVTLAPSGPVEIGKGKTIIIVATGTVTIGNNISYHSNPLDPLTSINDIPQLVIIAPEIDIAEGVSNVDAWLITDNDTGVVDTCSPRAPGALTSSICSTLLTVNGPVVANKLRLNRTANGDNATADKAAEIFNNRGDSYLWAMNYMRDRSQRSLVTTYQTELPPRY